MPNRLPQRRSLSAQRQTLGLPARLSKLERSGLGLSGLGLSALGLSALGLSGLGLCAALLGLTACGADPLAQDAADYSAAMEPALAQNAALGAEFLELAVKIRGDELPAERAGKRWHRKVVPLADELLVQVQQVSAATPTLQSRHQELVTAWSDRAAAYHQIDEAWIQADPQAMQRAVDANIQAKLAEEAALARLNAILGSYGEALDPFPDP